MKFFTKQDHSGAKIDVSFHQQSKLWVGLFALDGTGQNGKTTLSFKIE